MIVFWTVSTIRVRESPEILHPFIALYDILTRGYKIILCFPASALKEQLSSQLETVIYTFEHCQVVFDPVQAGKYATKSNFDLNFSWRTSNCSNLKLGCLDEGNLFLDNSTISK
jgi:hypothetical protein